MSQMQTYGNGLSISGPISSVTSATLSVNGTSLTNTGGVYIDTTFTPWEAVNFLEIDDELASILATSYKHIKDNCIHFNVYIDNKTVRPIDDILLMINKKEIFNIEIRRNGYKILVTNGRFIKIKNLIETSAKEYIKVEFTYDSMEYDNTLKSDLEKRSEKMDLLKHKINNDI